MANEFVARKGLISLNDSQFSGSVPIYVSASGGSGADLYVSGSGTNPRVGIGITTPAQALTVLGNVSGSGNLNMGGSITGSVVSSSLAQFGSATITAGTIVGGQEQRHSQMVVSCSAVEQVPLQLWRSLATVR